MGLIVDEIVDIVEQHLNVELSADRRGKLGSAIIAGRANDVLDDGFYLIQAFQDWFGSHTDAMGEAFHQRILLGDDSQFFLTSRNPLRTDWGSYVRQQACPVG